MVSDEIGVTRVRKKVHMNERRRHYRETRILSGLKEGPITECNGNEGRHLRRYIFSNLVTILRYQNLVKVR